MKLRNFVFGCVITLLISSCSTSPINKKYSDTGFEKDLIELRNTLTINELDMLSSYIFMKGGSENITNQSYAELLEEAIEFKKEEEERLRKEKELKEEKYKQMVNEMYEQLKDK